MAVDERGKKRMRRMAEVYHELTECAVNINRGFANMLMDLWNDNKRSRNLKEAKKFLQFPLDDIRLNSYLVNKR